jgi:hypothetical protein
LRAIEYKFYPKDLACKRISKEIESTRICSLIDLSEIQNVAFTIGLQLIKKNIYSLSCVYQLSAPFV